MRKKGSFLQKTIDLCESIGRERFESYYRTHNDKETASHFNISIGRIQVIVNYFNINPRTKDELYQCVYANRKGRRDNTLNIFNSINYEEFVNYYRNHSQRETCEKFNLKEYQLLAYIDDKNIVKTEEDIRLSKHDSTIRYCLLTYGVDNVSKCSDIINHIKNTNQENYSVDWYFQSTEFFEKSRKTHEERYGGVGRESELLNKKFEDTMIERYNVVNPMQSDTIKNTLNEHMMKKYGVYRYAQLPEFHKKSRKHFAVDNEFFDSSYELALWIYAKDHNEYIERCPVSFEYTYKGIKHKYIPDFKYKDKLIELKGEHFFIGDRMINPMNRDQDELYEAKHQCGLRNNVVFWTFKDIEFAINYCINKYNAKCYNWYKIFEVKKE